MGSYIYIKLTIESIELDHYTYTVANKTIFDNYQHNC
ncbi:hypothetical protein HNQ41_000653 [Texcoconibacillus texcoconensis]|uniref:Uncharacterized protein n=1 Tax=Texcoconibacillus texcoconensis TaxID=1095777 RepID=A0A840QMA7_9BACI|nr:hypothetical protein [Texcoconibacillus texcoconensis]